MGQRERIIQHFRSGNTITSLEAFSSLGVTQLASRIFDLKKQGYHIDSTRIKVSNRFGEECSVSEYYLVGE
jgi:hypothetical protein